MAVDEKDQVTEEASGPETEFVERGETGTYEEELSSVAHRRPKKVYAGMWGSLELAAVGFSAFLLLLIIGAYLAFVLPEIRRLDSDRARRDQLDKQLQDERKRFGNVTDTQTQVTKLVASAEDFEARYLQEESIGKTAIYQRLNGLIATFGLVNSTGPDYTPIQVTEEERRGGTNEQTERGRSKFQSLYPGVYVTMTVEGPYVNLRRFMNEIENSSEFIVISTIELEPSESADSSPDAVQQPGSAPATAASARETGRTRGKVVSLRLELAAYFQRPNEEKLLTDSGRFSSAPETGQ